MQRGSRHLSRRMSTWDEYLWFGSTHLLIVEGISIVARCKYYSQSVAALAHFDGVLSAKERKAVTKKHINILSFCLKYMRNEALPTKPMEVDDFVLDNFYCLCHNKTKVFLSPDRACKADPEFLSLIYYGIQQEDYSINKGPKDNSNIFRSNLLSLFPNLMEVEMWVTDGYQMNLLSLLSVLAAVDAPQTFQSLRIWGYRSPRSKWLKSAVSAIPDVVDLFAAKNFIFETESNRRGDFIVIKPKRTE